MNCQDLVNYYESHKDEFPQHLVFEPLRPYGGSMMMCHVNETVISCIYIDKDEIWHLTGANGLDVELQDVLSAIGYKEEDIDQEGKMLKAIIDSAYFINVVHRDEANRFVSLIDGTYSEDS